MLGLEVGEQGVEGIAALGAVKRRAGNGARKCLRGPGGKRRTGEASDGRPCPFGRKKRPNPLGGGGIGCFQLKSEVAAHQKGYLERTVGHGRSAIPSG